jgi:site-specific recombinase XerD
METDNGTFSDITHTETADLAVTDHPYTQGLVSLDTLVSRAREFVSQSKAEATKKAYASDWSSFTTWCQSFGFRALPASPETIATYISCLVSHGRKVATIQRSLVSISQAHKMGGFHTPTSDALVREVLKGVRRSLGTAQVQKAPALPDQIKAMLATLPDDLLGVRDRALLLLGFSGGVRRSELVDLDVADIEFTADGLVVTIKKSKADQESLGRKIGIPYGSCPATCPVRSLRTWLDAAGIRRGSVFRPVGRWGHVGDGRLDDRAVARVVKKYASMTGLDPEKYAGHSLRAGLATAAAKAGKSERSIMNQTGHRSVQMVRKYIRDGGLFLENAAAGLL